MKIEVDPLDRLVLDLNEVKVRLNNLLKWLDDIERRVSALEDK